MKRKDLLDHGKMRKLTDTETSEVVGGYSSAQISPIDGQLAINIIDHNVVGTLKGIISPDRKNGEVVPTAGVELATY